MGLSRNKVAVSEGAAGSPPFYGESTLTNTKLVVKRVERRLLYGSLFNFDGSFGEAKPNIAKQYFIAKRFHHEVISPAKQI